MIKLMTIRLVSLVEQMLQLHRLPAAARTGHERTALERQIEATDGQIDRLVCELYGLTEEEIEIVRAANRNMMKPRFYVYDEDGRRTGVIVPIGLWNRISQLVEDRNEDADWDPSKYRGMYKDLRIDVKKESKALRDEWTRL